MQQKEKQDGRQLPSHFALSHFGEDAFLKDESIFFQNSLPFVPSSYFYFFLF